MTTCPACGSEVEGGGCTNPFCAEWRFGAEFDALVDGDAPGKVRVARKQHRCECADPVLRWQAKGWFGGGWTAATYRTEVEASATVADMMSGRRQATVSGVLFDRAEVVPVENPNFRADCLGDIATGDRYFEYLGETPAYQSGSAYCARCAVAVWSQKVAP